MTAIRCLEHGTQLMELNYLIHIIMKCPRKIWGKSSFLKCCKKVILVVFMISKGLQCNVLKKHLWEKNEHKNECKTSQLWEDGPWIHWGSSPSRTGAAVSDDFARHCSAGTVPKASAGTVPKVELHLGPALLGANLSTLGTIDMEPNGNKLDFQTEAKEVPLSQWLNTKRVIADCPAVINSVFSLIPASFRTIWMQNFNWNRNQRQLGTRLQRKLMTPEAERGTTRIPDRLRWLPQTMVGLMQDDVYHQSRCQQQHKQQHHQQSCK